MTAAAQTSPRSMRLFAAVEPDAATRAALHDLQSGWAKAVDGIDGLRLLAPVSLHMTLRFFGDTPVARLAPLVAGLRRLAQAAQPCTATLRGIEYWPAMAPRVVIAAFEAPPALQALAADIEQLARGFGYPPEQRDFRAHVTLARSHGAPLPAPAGALPALALAVRAVSLVRSRLEAAGARYETIERLPVGEPDPGGRAQRP